MVSYFLHLIKINLVSEFNPVSWVVSPSTLSIQLFCRFISYCYLVLPVQCSSGLPIFSALKYHASEMPQHFAVPPCSPGLRLPAQHSACALLPVSFSLHSECKVYYWSVIKNIHVIARRKTNNEIFWLPLYFKRPRKPYLKTGKDI